jgi:hypothetical protein
MIAKAALKCFLKITIRQELDIQRPPQAVTILVAQTILG